MVGVVDTQSRSAVVVSQLLASASLTGSSAEAVPCCYAAARPHSIPRPIEILTLLHLVRQRR